MKRDAIDFEKDNVSVLFRRLLIPTLLGSISISAVTAFDGIFIGHGVGADGVAAVNIVVPIWMLMSGLALMIGMGCSVAASIHLSRHNERVARINITQAVAFASLLIGLISGVVMVFPYHTARLLGSSPSLMPLVIDYLMWIMPSFVFSGWAAIGLFIIRLDGSPKVAMWCNIIPALLNAVLDWVFIFPLGMGVKGAAIATSLSIVFGGVVTISYMFFFADKLKFIALKMSVKSMLLAMRNVGYHCKIGCSSLFGELTLAILVYIGNIVFMRYLGDDGVGAFGIACYYMPFFFMLGNSIAQSAQPIISYNYGISRWAELRKIRTLLLGTSLVIGVIVSALFVVFPDVLVGLFVDTNSEAGHIAEYGFPYFATGVIFFIVNVAVIGYYQSIEKIKRSTVFVFLRGFILLIPSFMLMPSVLGVEGIWLAMPLSELLTTLLIILTVVANRHK